MSGQLHIDTDANPVGLRVNAFRYTALARALLDAPDPVVAIAHELGDQHGRLDALCRRMDHIEATADRAKS